ncbi:hypothetical protein Tco_1025846 [Tanacetum coccineum]
MGTDSGIVPMGDVKFEDLFINDAKSPFDTESKIKMVKRLPNPHSRMDEDQITFLGPVYDDMETDQNVCISAALTKQPSAYYPKYLWEFWYTAEADTTTNSITFTLSNFDKPISFDLDVFSTIIGLKHSENFVSLPPKVTVRAGIATLGLIDENNTSDVIADDAAHKSLSGTSVQPVIQPKAKTNKMLRRKKILASSEPKASKIVRESPSTPQVVDTRHAEETMATIDTTQIEVLLSIDAESPFDTESKIKMVKRFQPPPMDDEDQITFLGPIYDDMETDQNVFDVKIISGSLRFI